MTFRDTSTRLEPIFGRIPIIPNRDKLRRIETNTNFLDTIDHGFVRFTRTS